MRIFITGRVHVQKKLATSFSLRSCHAGIEANWKRSVSYRQEKVSGINVDSVHEFGPIWKDGEEVPASFEQDK